LPAFVVCFVDDWHCDWGEIKSLSCWFAYPLWTLFHVVISHLDLFWELSFTHLLIRLFVLSVFNFWAVYIFWILILFLMNSLQRFFPILWVVSSFWFLVPFLCRSFFNLMQFHSSVLALISRANAVLFRKLLLMSILSSVFPTSFH
jgi:hypothetical protein